MCEVTYFDIGDGAFVHSLASAGNLWRMTYGSCFGVPVNLVKSIIITPVTLLIIKITVIIIPADDEYLYMNVILLDYFDVLVSNLCHATPWSSADGLWV